MGKAPTNSDYLKSIGNPNFGMDLNRFYWAGDESALLEQAEKIKHSPISEEIDIGIGKGQNKFQNQNKKALEIALPRKIIESDKDLTLYVFARCPNKYHDYKMEPVTVGLICLDGFVREITAFYCKQENRYLSRLSDYQKFQSKYGFILTRVVFFSDNGNLTDKFGNDFAYNRAEHSELNLRGYNVGQKDNLSDLQRHSILAGLIDNEIMSKYEITDYINFLIETNGSAPNMENACQRWENDIAFVLNYKTGSQRKVLIQNIAGGTKRIKVKR